jgi:ligand-binding SRPBCC domain-containing protein
MIKTPFSRNEVRQVTVRRSTVIPKKRSEIEKLITHAGVEAFLKEMGHGALDAEISASEVAPDTVAEAIGKNPLLKVGDTVTVRLTQLEFAGFASLAQMLAAAKAPSRLRPLVESSSIFNKVGAGLDMAYGALRAGFEFSSVITSWDATPEALTYVDVGQKLPVPLKTWTHKHIVSDSGDGGMITDEITVDVDPGLAAPVVEGALRLHLESRAKAYSKLLA